MYYTERDPFTGEKVYVPKDLEEKQMQRALLHFNKPENSGLVKKALHIVKREDLIPVLLGSPEQRNRRVRPVDKNNRKVGKRK
jgi:hypothetical protein